MITIIDSCMGSGKTTFMIDFIKNDNNQALRGKLASEAFEPQRYLYITPLLSEAERIKDACPELNFCEPMPVDGSKLSHLATMIERGSNICSTHALFRLVTKDICDLIREKGYVLVIDEALECISVFDALSKKDKELLLKGEHIIVNPDSSKLMWNNESHGTYRGAHDRVKSLCDDGYLTSFNSNTLIWEMPKEFIEAFEDVYILTYLFQGSLMSSWLIASGLDYQFMTLEEGNLIPLTNGMCSGGKRFRDRITVWGGPEDSAWRKKGKSNPLSASWFDNQIKVDLRPLRASAEYFFRSISKTSKSDNAWTTFRKVKRELAGDRYTRGFIPCNTRATNEYRHKKALFYGCNIFYQPLLKRYVEEKGIKVDQDAYALSEMLQWIWRSQIRDDKPIDIFIPSERMRALFLAWLDRD